VTKKITNNKGARIPASDYRYYAKSESLPFDDAMFDLVGPLLDEDEKKVFDFFRSQRNNADVDNWTQEQYDLRNSIMSKWITVFRDSGLGKD